MGGSCTFYDGLSIHTTVSLVDALTRSRSKAMVKFEDLEFDRDNKNRERVGDGRCRLHPWRQKGYNPETNKHGSLVGSIGFSPRMLALSGSFASSNIERKARQQESIPPIS